MRIEVEPSVHCFVESMGAGPPVLLLHGWAFDHRVWNDSMRTLAEAGHSVYAMDLRGHGQSDHPHGDYSVERLGLDVATVLDALDLHDVTLVGWSLGGLTAFRVAVAHPHRLKRLVLVASNGVATARKPGFPFGAPAESYKDAVIDLEQRDRMESRRRLIAGGFGSTPSGDLSEQLLQLTLNTPSWAGASALATLMETDQSADAMSVSLPVTQIVGSIDPLHSARGGEWLADQVADFTRLDLDGCGHYPMFEVPDAFDRALLHAVRPTHAPARS